MSNSSRRRLAAGPLGHRIAVEADLGDRRVEALLRPLQRVVVQPVELVGLVVGRGPELGVVVGDLALPVLAHRGAIEADGRGPVLHASEVLEQAADGQVRRGEPVIQAVSVEIVSLPAERHSQPVQRAEQVLHLAARHRRLPIDRVVLHGQKPHTSASGSALNCASSWPYRRRQPSSSRRRFSSAIDSSCRSVSNPKFGTVISSSHASK